MNMTQIPFATTDWEGVAPVEYAGETGKAYWRTQQFGEIRVRMVEGCTPNCATVAASC